MNTKKISITISMDAAERLRNVKNKSEYINNLILWLRQRIKNRKRYTGNKRNAIGIISSSPAIPYCRENSKRITSTE